MRLNGAASARRLAGGAVDGHWIDLFGKVGELAVRFFFFIESLLKQRGRLRFAEFFGKRADGAVAGDLIMLDALSGGDESCVLRGAFEVVADHFTTFIDEALHALAFFS